MAKDYVITIDDQDAADNPAAPYTLTVAQTNDDNSVSGLAIAGEAAIVGSDVQTMLRELADAWPTVG